jgi:hypothetical protein
MEQTASVEQTAKMEQTASVEQNDCDGGQDEEEMQNFFIKIENKITDLFKNYPVEENLCQIVEFSKWVKISGEDGKHYVVGIINKNDSPAYICYGLPGDYFTPPENLKGYSSFIPLSIFDLKGKGYWVMYQNAITGKVI